MHVGAFSFFFFHFHSIQHKNIFFKKRAKISVLGKRNWNSWWNYQNEEKWIGRELGTEKVEMEVSNVCVGLERGEMWCERIYEWVVCCVLRVLLKRSAKWASRYIREGGREDIIHKSQALSPLAPNARVPLYWEIRKFWSHPPSILIIKHN